MIVDESFDPSVYLEIEPGYYDRALRHGSGVQWFWQYHRLRLVRESLPAGVRRVLDLGCGPGTFLGSLPSNVRGVGVDLAGPQLDYAREHYGKDGRLDFVESDVVTADPGGTFDAAVAVEVIEHLPPGKTLAFLSNVRRLLAPGGTLLLTTPNYGSHWPLIEGVISRVGAVDYRAQHINRFTSRRLAEAVGDARFELVARRRFFVIAPFFAAISRRLADVILRLEFVLASPCGSELLLVARKPNNP